MSLSHSEEKPDHFYFRYLTLGEFLAGFKIFFILWLVFSALGLLSLIIFDTAKIAVVDESTVKSIPKRFWLWIMIALFSWSARGKTVTFPKLSFATWTLFNLWIAGAFLAEAYLPEWTLSPIACGLFLFAPFYERALEVGKANYERTIRN